MNGSRNGLLELSVDGLTVISSEGTEERARALGRRVAEARAWLDDVLGASPHVVVSAVAAADWSRITDFPVYGFPHFVGDDTIAVGGEPAPVFDHLVELTWSGISPELRDRMHATYGDPPRVQPFADLLVVHELAHLYHHQAGFWFPQRWLAELFANVCLDGYVSECAPELAETLRVFPQCASGMDDAVIVERELERMAQSLESGPTGPLNYAWFQMNLHQAAARVWAHGGVSTLQRLFRRFRDDAPAPDLRAALVEDVDPVLAEVIDGWR